MNTYGKLFTTVCMVATLSTSCTKEELKPLTLGQNIVLGGVVGAAEVAFPGQPLSYAMNQAMKKEPFVFSKSYAGFAANAGGQMPITAVQKAVQALGTDLVSTSQGAPLSDWQNAGVSYAAGVAGAVIDTPSNAVQLYQQNKANAGKNMVQALQALGSKSFRGFAPNAFMKEGPFAVGYQMLAGKGKEVAHHCGVTNNLAAVAVGGAAAGVFTAVVTHPGAVMRNKMQNDPHATTYTTLWQTAKKVFQEEGVRGFFKGLPQRGTRVAVAVPLYVGYTTGLEHLMRRGNKTT